MACISIEIRIKPVRSKKTAGGIHGNDKHLSCSNSSVFRKTHVEIQPACSDPVYHLIICVVVGDIDVIERDGQIRRVVYLYKLTGKIGLDGGLGNEKVRR